MTAAGDADRERLIDAMREVARRLVENDLAPAAFAGIFFGDAHESPRGA